MPPVDSHSRNLRKGRYSAPGIYYFLTTSVAGRRPIFTAPKLAYIVLDAINWLNSANRFIVDAAVVMPDHLHLVGRLGLGSRLEAAPTAAVRHQSRLEAAPTAAVRHQSRLEAAPAAAVRHQSRLEAAATGAAVPTDVTAPTAQVAPTLGGVMHSLKSYSARQLARIGVDAPIWQPGYHDHALRDDEDYGARVRYTLENPVRAGLAERPEAYPYVVLPEWWSGV